MPFTLKNQRQLQESKTSSSTQGRHIQRVPRATNLFDILEDNDSGDGMQEDLRSTKQTEHGGDTSRNDHRRERAALVVASPAKENIRGPAESNWRSRQPQKVEPTPISSLLSQDWRKPDKDLQEKRYQDARTQRTAASWRQQVYQPGPRTPSGVLYADQSLGAIVWHWDIRPLRSGAPPPNTELVIHSDGSKSWKKGRYYVILSRDGSRITEVAIYTNNNQGLKEVAPQRRDDFSSLRPLNADRKTFKNQSPNNKVLEIDWMNDVKRGVEGNLVRETMVVNVVEVQSRHIDIDELRLVGALSAESAEVLCKLVKSKKR